MASGSLGAGRDRGPAPQPSAFPSPPSRPVAPQPPGQYQALRHGAGPSAGGNVQPCRIVWFKCTDLRLHDHEPYAKAHLAADKSNVNVAHVFIYDDFWFSKLPLTGLAKTGPIRARFLVESVQDLRRQLRSKGSDLIVRRGSSASEIHKLAVELGAVAVHAYKEVCSEEIAIERQVKAALEGTKAQLALCHGFTLFHLDDLPFNPRRWFPKTYSGFRREVEGKSQVRRMGHEWGGVQLEHLSPSPRCDPGEIPSLSDLGLAEVPEDSRAAAPWKGGESAGLVWLQEYFWGRDLLRQYVGATNTMTPTKCAISRDSTSKLSPWLAHGCLSPRLIWWEIERYELQRVSNKSTYWMKHELIWRDYLRFGGIAWGDSIFKMHGIGKELSGIPWKREASRLDCWVQGQTGFPFVDCFMRELAATGYTTHCGRECVAWFVVRDLRLDWRMAAEYFEHILIDYEPTANWGNWAYRIAPTTGAESETVQTPEMLLWAQQHDPEARHIKLWIPELAPLPADVALEPWRLLIRELSPVLTQPWTCTSCTLWNEAERTRCRLCEGPREVVYNGFCYGADYPLPRYVEAQCVRDKGGKEEELRRAQVDSQLAANGMAGVDLASGSGAALLTGGAVASTRGTSRRARGSGRQSRTAGREKPRNDASIDNGRGVSNAHQASEPRSAGKVTGAGHEAAHSAKYGMQEVAGTQEEGTESFSAAALAEAGHNGGWLKQQTSPGTEDRYFSSGPNTRPSSARGSGGVSRGKARRWKVGGLDHLRK